MVRSPAKSQQDSPKTNTFGHGRTVTVKVAMPHNKAKVNATVKKLNPKANTKVKTDIRRTKS